MARDRSTGQIDRLDFDASQRSNNARGSRRNLLDDDVSFMNEVAEGVIERDRQRMKREATRTLSFAVAVLMCLCAGSFTTFSIYSNQFMTHLKYTQYQVNAVSITGELATYLPVPIYGYLCDRYSPRPVSLLSLFLAGIGYILAAYTYKSGPPPEAQHGGSGWPFGIMLLAFVGIGAGSSCMYLSALTACAKNYAASKYRGFMLAVPIAAIGIGNIWQSQVGHQLLSDRLPNGDKGPVNPFKYFIFLAILNSIFSILGCLCLHLVDEDKVIEQAIEDLEQSGLLDPEEFRHDIMAQNYGTLSNTNASDPDATSITSEEAELALSESLLLQKQTHDTLLAQKKTWLLNHATRIFLTDPTAWLLSIGFLIMTGTDESYINNVGTVIPTLTPSSYFDVNSPPAGQASTHVSIIALTSTFARIFIGTLSDLFAPPSQASDPPSTRVSFSRLTLLIPCAFLGLLGFLNLALPFLTPSNPSLLHLSSALVGFSYGATFSLGPIIVSVVWGAENFGTNFGIVMVTPALGAALFSLVYSYGYSRAAEKVVGPIVNFVAATGAGVVSSLAQEIDGGGEDDAGKCTGYSCFAVWAWACTVSIAVAIVFWGLAWRVWKSRNVNV